MSTSVSTSVSTPVSRPRPRPVAKPHGGADDFASWESAVVFRLFAERREMALSVPEQLAVHVADRILDGRMAPGSHVGEQALADEFEVSRGPVREAIRLLEREGLVTFWPRRGAVVTELSVDELRDIYEIRGALVDLVARKCAAMDDNGELQRILAAGLERLQALADDPHGGDRYAETVYRLQIIKARFCGNRRLQALLTTLTLQTLRYFKLGHASPGRRRQSLAYWKRWVAAMKRGDADAMREITQRAFADAVVDIATTLRRQSEERAA